MYMKCLQLQLQTENDICLKTTVIFQTGGITRQLRVKYSRRHYIGSVTLYRIGYSYIEDWLSRYILE